MVAIVLRETNFTPSTMSETSNNNSHFEINRSFAHLEDSVIRYPAEEDSLGQQSRSFDHNNEEEEHVLSPSNRSTCTTPQKQNHNKMRPSMIDRRANDENLYEGEPFFTSITASVSYSSEEAATQGMWSAARDSGKRGGGLFSRHRRNSNNSNHNNPASNYDDQEFLYSATDEERDDIWATDGRDESVEVVTPFTMPRKNLTNMKSIPHHQSLDSSSSRTTSTWMQGTVGSSSLLDGDDDDSVSTTSLGSSPCSSNGETNRSSLDDNDEDATYNTYEEDGQTLQEGDAEFMAFSQPVESFLDDLAENRSIRKIGDFFLARTCMTEKLLHEEEADAEDDDDENTFNTLEFEDYDEVYDDDDDDDDDDEEQQTSFRGRSRSPRRKDHPGIKLLFSLASSADSIIESAAEGPLWQRIFSCTGETDFEHLDEDEL